MLFRSIKSGIVDCFLVVAADIAFEHKQLNLLKEKYVLKAHYINNVL